ncbi:MAG: hypothetical protein JNL35_07530, partial [Sphingopyxis sp.]|nr:hypothetical protein [Sphingopyxis sp.]
MSAAISLDMGAYHYAQSLMAIGLMFQAASGSLAQQHAEIEQAKAEYDRHIEAGGEPIGEWEDGYCLWDQEKVYRLEQLAIEDALEELRVATAIAVYHIWERNIPNPLRKKRRTHAQLITDAGLAGVNLHPDIDALCFAANYFKHGTDTWRQKLLEHRSKRFRGVSVRARGVISGVGDGVFRGGACPTPECGVAGGHRVHRYGGVCTLQP